MNRNVPDRYSVRNVNGDVISAWPVKSSALCAARALNKRDKSVPVYACDNRNGEVFYQNAAFVATFNEEADAQDRSDAAIEDFNYVGSRHHY